MQDPLDLGPDVRLVRRRGLQANSRGLARALRASALVRGRGKPAVVTGERASALGQPDRDVPLQPRRDNCVPTVVRSGREPQGGCLLT